jgi:predicted tellurium resistance membrane protein TerC
MPDVKIKVESFDATSGEAMAALARRIEIPIGGCFIATLILDDGLFMRQTPESFHAVSNLKLKVFEAFTSIFNIETLDFFISLSSLMAVVGNSGQSSYAALVVVISISAFLLTYPSVEMLSWTGFCPSIPTPSQLCCLA